MVEARREKEGDCAEGVVLSKQETEKKGEGKKPSTKDDLVPHTVAGHCLGEVEAEMRKRDHTKLYIC